MFIWLALRFPFFKLEAQGVDIENEFYVVASVKKTVCAATPFCQLEGVSVGMPVSTAQALVDCKVLTRSYDKEKQFLQSLCDLLYVFTPYIQTYSPKDKDEYCDQGLLLELSRCTRLFGGIESLSNKIYQALSQFGVCFKPAFSKSAKAAWLLSAQEKRSNNTADILNIHTRTLDEFPDQVDALQKVGLRKLGDVKRQIDQEGVFSFKKRFGTEFTQYLLDILSVSDSGVGSLDHMEGVGNTEISLCYDQSRQNDLFDAPLSSCRISSPVSVYEPTEKYYDSVSFDFPIVSLELLNDPMQHLLKNLSHYLVSKQKQCQGVQWRFSDIYQNQKIIDVRCELVYRDWQLLHELTWIKLEQAGLPFEVDQLELINPLLIDASLNTAELPIIKSSSVCGDNRALQHVVTKIKARLGESNVFKVSYKDDHFPECSQKNISVEESALQVVENEHKHAVRPGWILNTPIKIGKKQNNLYWNGSLELIRGPERIEGHWWDKPTARDYFVAVRSDQVRLWVFNDLLRDEWFVQGVF